jgi:hypothetical protein
MLASFEVSAAISSAGSIPAMPASLREVGGPNPQPARCAEPGAQTRYSALA